MPLLEDILLSGVLPETPTMENSSLQYWESFHLERFWQNFSLCRQTKEFEEHWLICGISTDKGEKQADLEDQKTKTAFVAS